MLFTTTFLFLFLVAILVSEVFLVGVTSNALNLTVPTTGTSNDTLVLLRGAVEVYIKSVVCQVSSRTIEHLRVTLFQSVRNLKIVSTVVVEVIVVLGFFLGLGNHYFILSIFTKNLVESVTYAFSSLMIVTVPISISSMSSTSWARSLTSSSM